MNQKVKIAQVFFLTLLMGTGTFGLPLASSVYAVVTESEGSFKMNESNWSLFILSDIDKTLKESNETRDDTIYDKSLSWKKVKTSGLTQFFSAFLKLTHRKGTKFYQLFLLYCSLRIAVFLIW